MFFKTLCILSCICLSHIRGSTFNFEENLIFNDFNFYAKDHTFIYGDSGCGPDNTNCWCKIDGGKTTMHGEGTTGTATGLTFTCSFSIHEPTEDKKLCDCSHYVDIPYSKSNKDTFDCPCLKIDGYKHLPEDGHDFTFNRDVRLKQVPVEINYCKSGRVELNKTHCFSIAGSYFNLVYTKEAGDCPENLPYKFDNYCYAKCNPKRVNFQDRCVDKTSISTKTVAGNPCLVDYYEQTESEGGKCEDDCDCNGDRCCKNGKCQKCDA